MELFILGVLATLLAVGLLVLVFPILGEALIQTLWELRASRLFIWAVFDTYFRQKGWKSGPRLGHLSRPARRRIERFRVKVGLL